MGRTVIKMLELGWVGFSIETWHSRAEAPDPATGQCVYRSCAWLGNRIVVKMSELCWVGFSIETWHSRAETLDPATGQCVYRSWAWLGNTIQRARERGWNWDAWVPESKRERLELGCLGSREQEREVGTGMGGFQY